MAPARVFLPLANQTFQKMKKYLKKNTLSGFQPLGFLAQIIMSSGKSLSEIGDEIGLTGSALSYIFLNGDTRLSVAERIATACGFSLSFEFRDQRINAKILEYDQRDRERYGRLGFITVALKYRGLSRAQIADMLGKEASTARYWFRANSGGGDIVVSYIYRIAKLLDLDVVITAKRRALEADEGKPKVTTIISSKSEANI